MELFKNNIILIFMVIFSFRLIKFIYSKLAEFFYSDLSIKNFFNTIKLSKQQIFLGSITIISDLISSIGGSVFILGLLEICKESEIYVYNILLTIIFLYLIKRLLRLIYRNKFENDIIRKFKTGECERGLGVRACEEKEKIN